VLCVVYGNGVCLLDEINMENTNTLRGYNVEFLLLNVAVDIITTKHNMVKNVELKIRVAFTEKLRCLSSGLTL
jgi:hypothetical protein